jgi:peptidoglycan/LPS O-acetylase OafA/YrhL
MYIFLFHYPVMLYVTMIFNHYNLNFGWATGLIEMIIYLLGSFLLPYMAWYWCEGRKLQM